METALILTRALHFAVAMLIWGAAILRVVAFSPGTLRATQAWAVASTRALAAANLLTALVWLFATAAIAGDGAAEALTPAVLAPLLSQTHFGHVWMVHLVLAAVLLLTTRQDRPRPVSYTHLDVYKRQDCHVQNIAVRFSGDAASVASP